MTSAASGATLGLSDVALAKTGMVDPRDLAAQRETTAGQLGHGTGLAAAMLAAPEIGAAKGAAGMAASAESAGVMSTALRTAVAPALASRAAAGAVRDAAGAAMGAAAESVAGRAALAGIHGATDAAVWGAGNAMSEHVLGNPDTNASSLFAAGMGGAMLGAVGGGLVGGALGFAGAKLGDAIAGRAGAEALPAPDAVVAGIEARSGEALSERGKGLLIKGYKRLAGIFQNATDRERMDVVTTAAASKYIRDGQGEVEKVAAQLVDHMNDMQAVASEENAAAFGGLRKEVQASMLPKGAGNSVLSRVADTVDALSSRLDQIEAAAGDIGLGKGGANTPVKRIRDALDATVRDIKAAAKMPDTIQEQIPNPSRIADWSPETVVATRATTLRDLADKFPVDDPVVETAFNKLDFFKRLLQKPGDFEKDLPDESRRQLAGGFREMYTTLRNHLESTEVYGEAGNLQRDVNSAYEARAKAMAELEHNFRVMDSGKFDPSSVANYVNKIDRLKGDRATEALDAWHQAHQQYAGVMDKYFQGAGLGDKAKLAMAKFTRVREELADRAVVWNNLRALSGSSTMSYGMAGGVIAGSAYGAGGVTAGLVAGAIINPGRGVIVLNNLAAAAQRVSQTVAEKTGALVNGEVGTGIRRAVAQTYETRNLAVATAKMLTAKSPAERRQAYEQRVAELQALSQPGVFGDHAARQVAPLADAAPAHATALSNTAAAAVNHLQATLPASASGARGDGSVVDGMYARPAPRDQDILRWAERDAVAQDPLTVLRAAERGRVALHMMDTLRQVHPAMAGAIRAGIVDHQSAQPASVQPGTAKARVLATLMGAPPADPSRVAHAQAVHAMVKVQAQQAAQQGPRASSKVATKSSTMVGTTAALDTYPGVPR
jgi:hypothetical protein